MNDSGREPNEEQATGAVPREQATGEAGPEATELEENDLEDVAGGGKLSTTAWYLP